MTKNGKKAMAIREHNAGDRFVSYAIATAGLTKAQAEHVLKVYQRAKVIRLDPVTGQFSVKHGAFLDVDVLINAAR